MRVLKHLAHATANMNFTSFQISFKSICPAKQFHFLKFMCNLMIIHCHGYLYTTRYNFTHSFFEIQNHITFLVTIREGYDKDLRFMISIASDRLIKKNQKLKKNFSVERTQITVLPLLCSSVNLHATIDRRRPQS